jgi:hypothetical protein
VSTGDDKHSFRARLAHEVGYNYARPLRREAEGDCPANATAGPNDYCHLPLQAHLPLLLRPLQLEEARRVTPEQVFLRLRVDRQLFELCERLMQRATRVA